MTQTMTQTSTIQHSISGKPLQLAIVGAGLAGLYLAYLLIQQRGASWAQHNLRIYEARQHSGGRILGIPAVGNATQLDMGPSWVWPQQQPLINNLLSELQIPVVRQWQQGAALYQSDRMIPPQRYLDTQTYADACRIAGGSKQLVDALSAHIPGDCIAHEHELTDVSDQGDQVQLSFRGRPSASAARAVLSLPPRLISTNIQFDPPLNSDLGQLMAATPTWMAGHAKVAIHYETPFWRQAGYSGAALANYRGAPLAEVFDACGPNGVPAALGGFMGLPALMRQQWRGDLHDLILDQLIQLFGQDAAQPLSLHIQDWYEEPFTAVDSDAAGPQSHPEYGHQWLSLDHWNDKLFFSGTETAEVNGGYMEGALYSAQRVARALNLSATEELTHA